MSPKVEMLASDYVGLHLLFDHFPSDELLIVVLALLDKLLSGLGCVLLDNLGVVVPIEQFVVSHLVLEVVRLLLIDLVVLQRNVGLLMVKTAHLSCMLCLSQLLLKEELLGLLALLKSLLLL